MTFIIALMFSLAQSAPYIVIGYLVAAGIKEFVPVGMLTRHFGEKGVRPLFHALGIGLILPICSCGVIPLGVGAFKCGSARGTPLTFMTSAPTVAPVAILLSISLLGVQFTASYVIIALAGSLLIGLLGNWLLGGKAEAEFRASRTPLEAGEQLQDSTHRTLSTKLAGALRWAFWDLGSDVSIDLLFGIALAAAILAFVPVDWISSWLGRQSIFTLFYVILVAIPLYTCSTPSIPVVQSLLLKGISPGAAVAYLIAGPATNMGEIAAIKRSMGKGAAALFVRGSRQRRAGRRDGRGFHSLSALHVQNQPARIRADPCRRRSAESQCDHRRHSRVALPVHSDGARNAAARSVSPWLYGAVSGTLRGKGGCRTEFAAQPRLPSPRRVNRGKR